MVLATPGSDAERANRRMNFVASRGIFSLFSPDE
jgi:hypothetical protein